MSAAAGNQADLENKYAATDAENAASDRDSYQKDINDYTSNVNSALAAGNPFEAKDYLTKQNLETSGAMNSENDAAKQQQQQTVARTGTNSAALAGDVASSARQGQRDLTQYNAGRDTANENTWLGQQDKLLGAQLGGANSEAGVYSADLTGEDSLLSSAQSGKNAQTQANNASTFGPFYHG